MLWISLSSVAMCVQFQSGCSDVTPSTLSQSADSNYVGPYPEDADRQIDTLMLTARLSAGPFGVELYKHQGTLFGRLATLRVDERNFDYNPPWLRDLLLPLAKRGLLTYTRTDPVFPDFTFAKNEQQSIAYAATASWGGSYATMKWNWGQEIVEIFRASLARLILQQGFVDSIVPTDLYMEGGDVITARRSDKTPVVLLGLQGVIASASLLGLAGFFETHAAELQQTSEALRITVNQDDLDETKATLQKASQEQATGMIAQIEASIASETDAGARAMGERALERFRQRSLIPDNFGNASASASGNQTELALRYLAKLELIRHRFVEAFKVPDDQVVIVPNAFPHLDYFIKPVIPGTVLMPKNESYTNSAFLQAQQGNVWKTMGQAKKAIRDAGLTIDEISNVIRVDVDGTPDKNLVFSHLYLNGIMGTATRGCASEADKSKRRFYLTNSTSPAEDDAFAAALSKYDIRTYFLPAPGIQGGTRCGTLELDVTPF